MKVTVRLPLWTSRMWKIRITTSRTKTKTETLMIMCSIIIKTLKYLTSLPNEGQAMWKYQATGRGTSWMRMMWKAEWGSITVTVYPGPTRSTIFVTDLNSRRSNTNPELQFLVPRLMWKQGKSHLKIQPDRRVIWVFITLHLESKGLIIILCWILTGITFAILSIVNSHRSRMIMTSYKTGLNVMVCGTRLIMVLYTIDWSMIR